MVKISIIKKSIVVSDFSEKFGPDIIDMLSNQWNFEEEGKKLRYGKEFDSMFIYKIYLIQMHVHTYIPESQVFHCIGLRYQTLS